jgi:hypothetical protein
MVESMKVARDRSMTVLPELVVSRSVVATRFAEAASCSPMSDTTCSPVSIVLALISFCAMD